MKKPSNKNLTDQTEQRIYMYIRQNGYTVGDLLPKEEELAAELEVSRTITREALSRLKAAGIIESRRRRGMILTKPDLFAGLDKLISFGMLDAGTRQELSELRLVIELGLPDLIFKNKTPEAIAELKNIAGKFLTATADSHDHAEIEQEFHRCLFSLSGNKLIERFQLLLEPFFTRNSQWDKNMANEACHDHLELAEALEGSNGDLWREKLHRHFAHYFD